MINFKNRKIAILGLGLEGRDLVKFLLKQKAIVTVFDQKEKKGLDTSGFDNSKVNFVCGGNYLSKSLSNFDLIFRSPGVYRHIPRILQAEKAGVEISSATKLFFDLCPAKIIGVTGTKGKGTTATLIYQILKKDIKDVYIAGNIGKPLLELLPKLKKTSWVVLELSSFQLIDLHKSPHIAVVLNITTDHLDWHKDRNEYLRAKLKIVQNQSKNDYAILNSDYKSTNNFSKHTKAQLYYFSMKNKVIGSCVVGNEIFITGVNKNIKIGKIKDLKIIGKHNWENVCAAICASYLAGATVNSIKQTVFSFKGLEHRLKLVREFDGVKFYNDSLSTNSQTTIAAINSFDEPVTLILGGSDKGLAYSDLAEEIKNKKNVKVVILIGEIGSQIGKEIRKVGYSGKLLNLGKTTIKNIVDTAFQNSQKGGVVLLSPAAASFDMFENYKDRGNQFKRAVKMLSKC